MKYHLPNGYNFFQSLWRTYKQAKRPLETMGESMQKYRGTYAVNLGFRRMIATQDPGFIEYVLKTNHKNYYKSVILTKQLGRFLGKGLLTSNGEYWLRQRRLIQPGFHHEKLQGLYAIMQRTIGQFLDGFPHGEVDVYPHMNRLAFDIVINTLFNVKIDRKMRDELSAFITEVQDFVIRDIRQPYKSWWFRLSGEEKKNLERSEGARNIIRFIIRQRRESGARPGDLLDMLLDARYEDNGEPMQENQVIDEILILLIAGHETTANALSWTLYLLALHPDELQKLKQATQDPDMSQIITNESLSAVINESMRLYPPAWISDRVPLQDDHFHDFNYPKDTILVLFYYGLHRDPRYWKDPDAFLPERFLKQNALKEKQKIFFPFGAGPRLCIGNNFAMAEMALAIRAMIHRFEFEPAGITPKLKPLVTLRPDRVILKIRTSK